MSTFRLPAPGGLVMYEHEGTPLLGIITAQRKERFVVWNEREREIELTSARLYLLPDSFAKFSSASSKEKTEFLRKLRGQATALAIDLEELWAVVAEEPREYTDLEMCDLLLGEVSLLNLLALRFSLLEDKVLFKRTKIGFEPRDANIVEELRTAEEVRREREHALRESVSFLQERIAGSEQEATGRVKERLSLLLALAAGASNLEGSRLREARDLLSALLDEVELSPRSQDPRIKPTEASRAFDYLVASRLISADENLFLLKHGIENRWQDEPLTQAEHLSATLQETKTPPGDAIVFRLENLDRADTHPEIHSTRLDDINLHTQLLDLRNEFCVTIDDISTLDIDDALSVSSSPDGPIIGIHITDVASAIPVNSPLDHAARHRATSVYCPDIVVPMLPHSLSEQGLSLVAKHPRRALSVLVSFNHSFAITSIALAPSVIEVSHRMTYDEVDDHLDDPESETSKLLVALSSAASAFEELRLRMGAQNLDKREAIPRVEEDGKVSLLVLDEESPSRKLVSEMMILYNWIIARVARQAALPLPFRSQEPPDSFEEPNVPEGPARDFALRSRLKRSTVSLEASYHYTLGLSEYVQSSSPIRRYLDLVTQRQVMSYLLKGSPQYQADELQKIIFTVEDPLMRALNASKESRRYWLLKYLEQRPDPSSTIYGTLVRQDERVTLAFLEEIWTTLPVKVRSNRPLGAHLTFKIEHVNPRYDLLKLIET